MEEFILHIETATLNCSVSIGNKGKQIAYKDLITDSYSHAENLHLLINNLLKEQGISYSQLKSVAVSKGPGSYTGLRIGAAAAKGICFSLQIPLITIGTLEILALSVTLEKPAYKIPMIDARRNDVYFAVYNHLTEELNAPAIELLEEKSFHQFLAENKVHFMGTGTEKSKSIIHHKNAIFTESIYPSAKFMVKQAYKKYKSGDFEEITRFEPLYLKEFLSKN